MHMVSYVFSGPSFSIICCLKSWSLILWMDLGETIQEIRTLKGKTHGFRFRPSQENPSWTHQPDEIAAISASKLYRGPGCLSQLQKKAGCGPVWHSIPGSSKTPELLDSHFHGETVLHPLQNLMWTFSIRLCWVATLGLIVKIVHKSKKHIIDVFCCNIKR